MSTNDGSADSSRRNFLRSGIVAAAGVGAAWNRAGAASPAEPVRDPVSGLPMRKLGKTGWTLPLLAMGGSAMVQRFISGYGVKLLPVEERVAMVRHAYDLGIRYFDAARIYDECEEIYGRALKGVRDKVYLATKTHATSPAGARKSVESSLKAFGVDRIDCVQIHSPAIEMSGFEGAMKVHAELVKMRDEGLFKFIGLTTHVAFDTVLKLIETAGFDQVLLAYGYFRKGMDTLLSNRNIELRDQCVAKAHELGMGVVAMKVLGANVFSHNSGNLVGGYDASRLERLPGAAIRWVLQDPRVSLLNIGVSTPGDVDANVAILKAGHELTPEDRALLAEFSGRAYEADSIKSLRVV